MTQEKWRSEDCGPETVEGILDMAASAPQSPAVGSKLQILATLQQNGVRVPRGVALPFDMYSAYAAELLPAMSEACKEFASDYAALARRLREIILAAPFGATDKIRAALEKWLPHVSYFAVRSSAMPFSNGSNIAEYSPQATQWFGWYDSFLMVPGDIVPRAVQGCYASLFSRESLERFQVLTGGSDYLRSRMSVLVQEMHIADLSVWVSTRELGTEYMGVEVAYGACEGLMSGEAESDSYWLNRSTGGLARSELLTKKARVSYDPLMELETSNQRKLAVPAELTKPGAASEELLGWIYRLGMRIENLLGAPQIIQMILSKGELIVTLCRPLGNRAA